MTKQEILNVIDSKGYIVDYNLSIEASKNIKEMVDDKVLTSIKSLGIKFLNENYFFTYSDNRFNLKVGEICYNLQGLEKG